MVENLHTENTENAGLNAAQRADVVARAWALIRLARSHFDRPISAPDISFNLTGQRAGLYAWRRGGQCHIDCNPAVFAADFAHHLQDTVAHEVAHHVAYQLFGHRIKPHGREWKQIAKLLGAQPRARGDYSLAGVNVRRQRRHDYQCRCNTWPISTTRHNRIQKGAVYRCRMCGDKLRLTVNQLQLRRAP